MFSIALCFENWEWLSKIVRITAEEYSWSAEKTKRNHYSKTPVIDKAQPRRWLVHPKIYSDNHRYS